MAASALFLGLLGLAATFLPQEILAWAGIAAETTDPTAVLLVQALGAAYLGFAILNWMAKGILIGGIYAKPVALGNFLHFTVIALALVKVAFGGEGSAVLVGATVLYALFAAWFGVVMFTDPAKRSE